MLIPLIHSNLRLHSARTHMSQVVLADRSVQTRGPGKAQACQAAIDYVREGNELVAFFRGVRLECLKAGPHTAAVVTHGLMVLGASEADLKKPVRGSGSEAPWDPDPLRSCDFLTFQHSDASLHCNCRIGPSASSLRKLRSFVQYKILEP